jgi:hypothetical protein
MWAKHTTNATKLALTARVTIRPSREKPHLHRANDNYNYNYTCYIAGTLAEWEGPADNQAVNAPQFTRKAKGKMQRGYQTITHLSLLKKLAATQRTRKQDQGVGDCANKRRDPDWCNDVTSADVNFRRDTAIPRQADIRHNSLQHQKLAGSSITQTRPSPDSASNCNVPSD